MKILLINGPIPYENAVTHIPLELSYIAALLKKENFEVKGMDLALERNLEVMFQQILAFNPDIIITPFSRVLFDGTRCLKMSLDFFSKVKNKLPKTLFCAIGEQATFRTQRTLDYHFVDFAIRFSPEITAKNLCVAIQNKEDIENICGVFTKNNVTKKILDPTWINKMTSLDVLGIPDRTVFNLKAYLAKDTETIIEASRGCNHRCVFCQRSRYHGNNIERSIPIFLEDLRNCIQLGFKSVFFTDLDFCRKPERALIISRAIIDARIKIKWACNMRADIIDEENYMKILTTMKQAGCYRVFVGLESANDDVLSAANKGITKDYGIRLKKILDDIGIKLHASFLIGLPDDDIKKMNRTVQYAKELKADMTSINALIPLPGTPYGDKPAKYGLSIENNNINWFEQENFLTKQVAGNKHLTAEEIENWHKDAYKRLLLDD